jgi:hypothetical protein
MMSSVTPVKTSTGVFPAQSPEKERANNGRSASLALTEGNPQSLAGSGLTRALVLEQMARHLVQKAVEVALRLKNMANDALSSREFDYSEIAAVNRELRATLGPYADRLNIQVMAPAEKSVVANGSGKQRIGSDYMAAAKELMRLEGYASRMLSGEKMQSSEISRVSSSLLEISRELDGNMGRQGTVVMGGSLVDTLLVTSGSKDVVAAISDTRGRITAAAGDALRAQGNLSHSTVKALLK